MTGFAPADTAQTGDLTFAENHAYFARADKSAASAILVDGDFASGTKVLIRVPDARLAFAKVLPLFFPEPAVTPGAHPTAVIAATADVHPTAHIGPFCVIGERVRIGPGCVLDAMVFVGDECKLGEKVRLFPQVTLTRSRVQKANSYHFGSHDLPVYTLYQLSEISYALSEQERSDIEARIDDPLTRPKSKFLSLMRM
ncbi:MAG: LpxD N-terminal domain-containing protein [Verrucomicrobiota bacterium]|nr:LpxD N-terminal domain-containing protein [Verrucomicrobiota bacterium]